MTEKYGLLLYSLIVNIFMGAYFFYIIPMFLYRFIFSFPNEVQELILSLSNHVTPSFALLRNISMQLLFLTLLGLFFIKLIRSLKKNVKP